MGTSFVLAIRSLFATSSCCLNWLISEFFCSAASFNSFNSFRSASSACCLFVIWSRVWCSLALSVRFSVVSVWFSNWRVVQRSSSSSAKMNTNWNWKSRNRSIKKWYISSAFLPPIPVSLIQYGVFWTPALFEGSHVLLIFPAHGCV